MSNAGFNQQDSFLNQVRKDGTEIEVMLSSGAAFRGQVRGFDNFTVVIQVSGMQHLVYKHAIAQLISPRPMRMMSEGKPEHADRAKSGAERPAGGKPEAESGERFNAIDLSVLAPSPGKKSKPREKATAGEKATEQAARAE